MPQLEGLRGLAVSLVFLVHFATLVEPWFDGAGAVQALMYAVRCMGHAGVDLFFLLSGMLIYGTLMRRQQRLRAFLARRLRRIYPAFLAVLATYVAIALLVPSLGKLPETGVVTYLLANVLLLPGLWPITPIITVAWSLSYEMSFYLAAPLVVRLCRLGHWPASWRVAGLAGLATGLFAWFALHEGPVRLVLFLGGALLHEVLHATRARAPGFALALVGLALALGPRIAVTEGAAFYTAKVAASWLGFSLLCWSALARPRGSAACWLSWAPLRWLGNMSYSYYLAHSLALVPLFMLATLVLPPATWGALGGVLLLAPAFALSLVPSLLLFLLVERPFSLEPRSDRPARSATLPGTWWSRRWTA
jgi:peptidoglycan/LPS O-acetylase OafA/YrhL